MKKIIIAILLFLVLITLFSCKEKEPTYDANEFFPLTEEVKSLEIASYDGTRQLTAPMLHREVANETKLLDEIMNSFRDTPSVKVENFSHDKIKLPIYGIEFVSLTDNSNINALFSNGYLLTSNGEVYKFEYDFAALMEKDFQEEVKETELLKTFPSLRLAAYDNGKWVGDFMPAAVTKYKHNNSLAQAGASLEIKGFDGKAVHGIIHNNKHVLLEYGEPYDFHALVDGEWKDIPYISPYDYYFIMPLYSTTADFFEKNFYIEQYAPLPAGRYRIIFSGLTAEFDIE